MHQEMKIKGFKGSEDILKPDVQEKKNSNFDKSKETENVSEKGKGQNDEESEEKMVPILLPADKATCIPIDEMERIFQTNLKKGLSEDEAKRRKRIYGSNDFDVGEDLPLWKKYLNQV